MILAGTSADAPRRSQEYGQLTSLRRANRLRDALSERVVIGNASGQTFGAQGISIRGVFDGETRRKPLAFAADAVRYGISKAVGRGIEHRENTGEL